MSIWSRIKSLFAPLSTTERIDLEDAMRGSDWTELDSLPDSDLGGEMPCFNIHPDRLDYSDPKTPAIYRKEVS